MHIVSGKIRKEWKCTSFVNFHALRMYLHGSLYCLSTNFSFRVYTTAPLDNLSSILIKFYNIEVQRQDYTLQIRRIRLMKLSLLLKEHFHKDNAARRFHLSPAHCLFSLQSCKNLHRTVYFLHPNQHRHPNVCRRIRIAALVTPKHPLYLSLYLLLHLDAHIHTNK